MTTRLPDAAYRMIGQFGNSRLVSRLHPVAYRAVRGRGVIGRNFGVRNVVLTTTGRQSGRPRAIALYGNPDGDRWVVVGSKGGAAVDPSWVANLRADPRATLRVGGEAWPVRGREADGDERERLWALVCRAFPGFEVYQLRTARRLPVVVLERDGHDGDPGPPGSTLGAAPRAGDEGDPSGSRSDPSTASPAVPDVTSRAAGGTPWRPAPDRMPGNP